MMNLTMQPSRTPKGIDNEPDINPQEVKYLWKKIDRRVRTTSTELDLGEPNLLFQTDDDIPLRLTSLDGQINAFGGLNAQTTIDQLLQKSTSASVRRTRYKQLHDALEHPEITGVLNIYADEATTEDRDGNIIKVIHDDDEMVEIVETMFERIGMYHKAWHIVRNMCGMGDDFYEIVISQSLKRILQLVYVPREAVERLEQNGKLIAFKFNSVDLINQNAQIVWQAAYLSKQEKENEYIYPFRIAHFKIDSAKYDPYGESIVDSVITSLEMLSMMEKAMMLARITRAPERRIFHIDVGTLTGEAALKYATNVMNNFKSKKRLDLFLRDKIDYQRDVWGVTEDIAIPKRTGSEGNSIDTLPQLNQPAVEDLDWVRNKIFPGVGVPRQYLFDDTFANANMNLSSKSVPFAKRIRRVQRYFLRALYKLAYIELKLNGYSYRQINELTILMNNPSNIDEKERIEIENSKYGLVQLMKSMNTETIFIPDYVIYKDVLQLGDEEIVEWMKLAQLQAAGKNVFEAFPEEERPEGSEDLTGMAKAAGEAPAAGGGAPAGGAEGAPPAEGEAGAEGEAPPEEVPGEVAAALGPPPGGAEAAEFIDETTIKKKYYAEAESIKQRFIETVNELKQKSKEIITQDAIPQIVIHKKKQKPSVYMEEIFMTGEFEGFGNVFQLAPDPDEIVVLDAEYHVTNG